MGKKSKSCLKAFEKNGLVKRKKVFKTGGAQVVSVLGRSHFYPDVHVSSTVKLNSKRLEREETEECKIDEVTRYVKYHYIPGKTNNTSQAF